jgi:Tfp pilus assembly protein FimV
MSAPTAAPTAPTAAPTAASLGRRPSAVARSAPPAPTRATYWRRRAVAVAVLLVVAFVLTALIGRVGAEAELEDKIAGHVVVQPGETLWDVAVATAPDGVDPREQLRAVAELNGLDSSSLDAWSVVLVPAR